jgi:hypothetical protein
MINKKLSRKQLILLRALKNVGTLTSNDISILLFDASVDRITDKQVWALVSIIGDSTRDRLINYNNGKYSLSQYSKLNLRNLI